MIGVALAALGHTSDAIMSVRLAVIRAVQDARAKRKLDRIALMTRSGVTVVPDGVDRSVARDDVRTGEGFYEAEQMGEDSQALR